MKDDIDNHKINYYVYMTENTINNKRYIGKRICKCDIENDKYLGSGKILKQAIKKYGKENFIKTTLEICETEDELNNKEKYWIKYFDACNNDLFYNIAEGGTGGDTFTHLSTKEQDRIRKIQSQYSSGQNNPMYGKHHSQNTKEKIRIGQQKYLSSGKKWGKSGMTGASNSLSQDIKCIETNECFHGIREASRIKGIPFPNIIRSLNSNGYYSAGKLDGQRLHWIRC